MVLSTGTRLGPYEIQDAIGAGGMGEVYRAYDTRLDRTVAIKVLPAHVASDPEVRERFEREAKTLAALSHPHICPVFDVGRHEGIDFLVMEHLEGETLAERLARHAGPEGPALRVEEVLRFAIQIADALDKAHRKGIVHRDLKPGNIMLTKSGAKLLDFGLAKMLPSAGAVAGMSIAATVSRPLTGQGTILGTLHYMAPEQVEGKEADPRSDIFGFGAVVYEMATGQKAFAGKSAASIIAAILEREPPALSTLQPLTPRALDHVVSHCLAKDPDERWQSAGDVMRELKWIAEAGSRASVPSPTATRSGRREQIAWAGLAIVAAVATALGLLISRAAPIAPEMRVDIATPPSSDPLSLAISADGQKVVFAALSDGQPRLWLRSLDSTDARPLPGTDRGRVPFWSADGRSIGFFTDGTFKRLDLETGLVRDLLNAVISSGGAWNHEGVILLSMGNVQPIRRVLVDGGEPIAVTRNVAGSSHRTPRFLPDGRHFLYTVASSSEDRGVYVAALDGSQPRRLLDVESPAEYASGHLFYLLRDTLVARAFDPIGLSFTSEPARVAEGVAAFAVSANGSIAYRTGTNTGLAAPGVRHLVWFDRAAKSLGTLADFAAMPALAPDGRRVAVHRSITGQNTDVWLLETTREGSVRFTTNSQTDAFPVWSPDSREIAFQSYKNGRPGDLFRKSAVGTGPEEPLLMTEDVTHPTDWSPDGRFLLYRSQSQGSNTSQWNLWAVPVDGDPKPFPVVQTNFDDRDGQFSPDGKWIAFESNESGRYEVYIQPFPSGPKVPVSAGGGAQARWRRDGRELFYIAIDGRLIAVPIRFTGIARPPEIGVGVPLFMTNVGGAFAQGVSRQQYAVSADGQRFLMNTLAEGANASPITLILNWKPKP
jgi:eukaryotic-like serine/threonine-protein kinase